MSTAHTPGPWFGLVNNADRFEIQGTTEDGTHRRIAVVDTIEDARLIAAAPDLLEALRGAIPFIGYEGGGDQEAKEKAYEAIAKAGGAA